MHFDFNKAVILLGDAGASHAGYHDSEGQSGRCDQRQRLLRRDRRRGIQLETVSVPRGDAVANYLLNGGIQATQLRVHGYGKTDFVATNRTAEGRAQNRRLFLGA